jgi:dolichyl-phosphate beta-glucosyltransferase
MAGAFHADNEDQPRATATLMPPSADTIIVVPCYNEAARLALGEFVDFTRAHPAVRFLFVDDGSRDATLDVLRQGQEEHPCTFDVLALPRNMGKAEAVRLGFLAAFENAGAKYVGFWDADLATPLADVVTFRAILEAKGHMEIVFGSRVNLLGRFVRRNLLRHYIGRIFATMAVAVIRVPIYDTQCGAKLFRVSAGMKDVFREPFLSRWIFDVEIIARLMQLRRGTVLPQARDVIYEHPLEIWRDVKGSKIRRSDFFIVACDLFRIYWRYMRGGAGRPAASVGPAAP